MAGAGARLEGSDGIAEVVHVAIVDYLEHTPATDDRFDCLGIVNGASRLAGRRGHGGCGARDLGISEACRLQAAVILVGLSLIHI